MISAALHSSWDSATEDSSFPQSLSFSATKGLSVSVNEPVGLQFAAFSHLEDLPSIDESLFDFVEIPELEDVDESSSSPSLMTPFEDLMLDQIPALEEVFNDQEWVNDIEQWDEVQVIPTPSPPKATTPSIIVTEEPFVGQTEEVISASPISVSVESCGPDSPKSCYSLVSEEFTPPAEKRRRVSQMSMSSYCSIGGDSTWSPTSSSDSDLESHRGGRKSRYSPADRKERKKAQNRTAAERYRQKRKIQEETIGEEEQQLIDGNNELKIEATKLQAEVSCLKQLMREMLQAKGIKIPPRIVKK